MAAQTVVCPSSREDNNRWPPKRWVSITLWTREQPIHERAIIIAMEILDGAYTEHRSNRLANRSDRAE
eukprot:13827161-Alexandrium_andersonii.AAC.1